MGKSSLNYGELRDWFTSTNEACCPKGTFPIDKHQTFILDFEIYVNELLPIYSYFRVSFSTQYLLSLPFKSEHLMADATYQIVWEGYKVFLTGTSDRRRHFHPFTVSICTQHDYAFIFKVLESSIFAINSKRYRPKQVIGDGAGAITNGCLVGFENCIYDRLMCWSHVIRNCDKNMKIKNKEFANNIKCDLHTLQLSYDKICFDFLYKLFRQKWTAKKDQDVDFFLVYFDKTWVTSNINLRRSLPWDPVYNQWARIG